MSQKQSNTFGEQETELKVCPFSGFTTTSTFQDSSMEVEESKSQFVNEGRYLQQSECVYAQMMKQQQNSQQLVMGCPFLKTDKRDEDPLGKNLTQGYPLKYISRLDFLFHKNPIMGKRSLKDKKQFEEKTKFLQSFPYVVKHTLFLDQSMMSKMREVADIGQLFFISDDTKIKGNRAYDAGKYYEALEAYEQVLGCFVWLQPSNSIQWEEFENKVFKSLKFEGLVDEDVELKEKEIVREEDKEIEQETKISMILGTLVNSMLSYMSMHHFEEARKCINFIFAQNYWKDPELYFRKAQITYLDKSSSLSELRIALNLVESECLNDTVLNGKKWKTSIERYQSLKVKLNDEIESKIKQDYRLAKALIKTSSRIMIEGSQINQCDQVDTIEVMKIMNLKYSEIIAFFKDQDNQTKLQQAANEYQEFAKSYHKIQQTLAFKLETLDPSVVQKLRLKNILNEETQNTIILHLQEAKKEIAESIFFHAEDINSEVYNYAFQIYQEKIRKLEQSKSIQKGNQFKGSDEKPREPLFSIAGLTDPDRVPILHILLAIVLIMALFYFGSGALGLVQERSLINQWFRSYFRGPKY